MSPRKLNPIRDRAKNMLRQNPKMTPKEAVTKAAGELKLDVPRTVSSYGPTVTEDVSKDNLAEDEGGKKEKFTLEGIDFASNAAAELAREAGLSAEDFENYTPSGANDDFTKGDVEEIIEDQESDGEDDGESED